MLYSEDGYQPPVGTFSQSSKKCPRPFDRWPGEYACMIYTAFRYQEKTVQAGVWIQGWEDFCGGCMVFSPRVVVNSLGSDGWSDTRGPCLFNLAPGIPQSYVNDNLLDVSNVWEGLGNYTLHEVGYDLLAKGIAKWMQRNTVAGVALAGTVTQSGMSQMELLQRSMERITQYREGTVSGRVCDQELSGSWQEYANRQHNRGMHENVYMPADFVRTSGDKGTYTNANSRRDVSFCTYRLDTPMLLDAEEQDCYCGDLHKENYTHPGPVVDVDESRVQYTLNNLTFNCQWRNG